MWEIGVVVGGEGVAECMHKATRLQTAIPTTDCRASSSSPLTPVHAILTLPRSAPVPCAPLLSSSPCPLPQPLRSLRCRAHYHSLSQLPPPCCPSTSYHSPLHLLMSILHVSPFSVLIACRQRRFRCDSASRYSRLPVRATSACALPATPSPRPRRLACLCAATPHLPPTRPSASC